MFHRFTDATRAVIAVANREATRLGHQFICAGHLIAGLLVDDSGVSALDSIGADIARVRSQLDAHFQPLTFREGHAKEIVAGAIRLAEERGHSVIGIEHFALSLMADSEGTFCSILNGAGVDVEAFRAALVQALDRHPATSTPPDDVLRQIPELRSLFLQLDAEQKLKEEAIRRQDFMAAAKCRDETDRIQGEILDRFNRLNDGEL
jgi:ATP-dependent Clp protease ATP-binding subunit ClpA